MNIIGAYLVVAAIYNIVTGDIAWPGIWWLAPNGDFVWMGLFIVCTRSMLHDRSAHT